MGIEAGQIPRLRHDLGHCSVQCSEAGPFGGDVAGIDDGEPAVQRAEGAVMADVACDQDISPVGYRLDQRSAGTGSNGYTGNRTIGLARVPNGRLECSAHSLGELAECHRVWNTPQSAEHAGVGPNVIDVECRLFVGVGRENRLGNSVAPACRTDHLDANLSLPVEPVRAAGRRLGARTREERAGPIDAEAALRVVADDSGAGLSHRCRHPIGIVPGNEHDELDRFGRLQRSKPVDIHQPEHSSKSIGTPTASYVERRVHGKDRYPGARQAKRPTAWTPASRERRLWSKQQRVVRDHKIDGLAFHGPDNTFGDIVTDRGAPDRGPGVANLETDRIPGCSLGERRNRVDGSKNRSDGGHRRDATGVDDAGGIATGVGRCGASLPL